MSAPDTQPPDGPTSSDQPEQKSRTWNWVPIVLLGLAAGIGGWMLINWVRPRIAATDEAVAVVVGALAAVAIGSSLLRYLSADYQSVVQGMIEGLISLPKVASGGHTIEIEALSERLQRELRRERQLALVARELERIKPVPVRPTVSLSQAERSRIVTATVEQVRSDISESALASIESRFREQLEATAKVKALRGHFEGTRDRISAEVSALSKRSNLNLVIGILTTGAAITLLAYIVLGTNIVVEDWKDVIPGYILRLSLVAFIEIFAFFFLRMYRANLHDIKYFQNELTSVESRFVALEAALQTQDTEAIRAVLMQLGATERNAILRRGETTIDVERLRLENRSLRQLLDVASTISKRDSKQ